jgi:hypothetical protein
VIVSAPSRHSKALRPIRNLSGVAASMSRRRSVIDHPGDQPGPPKPYSATFSAT